LINDALLLGFEQVAEKYDSVAVLSTLLQRNTNSISLAYNEGQFRWICIPNEAWNETV